MNDDRVRALRVITAGTLTTVQDGGRRGYAALGVSPSGVADRPAAQLANRLVGNDADAAVLELTMGGMRARVPAGAVFALTGAPAALSLDGRAHPLATAVFTGDRGVDVVVGTPAVGLRSYLAVRGGIDVAPVLGSRSTDTLGGIGPAPVRAGDELPIGSEPASPVPDGDLAASGLVGTAPAVLAVRQGPRADWFLDGAFDTLLGSCVVVDERSDRIAVRLRGVAIGRREQAELPSEGLVRGAVQIPPDGQPLVFLADHPTTGGYPVLAVLTEADMATLAQVRPGQQIRWRRARP